MKDNSSKIFVRKVNNYKPDDSAYTVVEICGHIKEVRVLEKISRNISRYKRKSKDFFVDIETGEVHECKHNSSNNERKMKIAFGKLRKLINANFSACINERHVVLTYAKMNDDFDKASKDFKRFWEKLYYHYSDLEYIRVIEPQHTGSWHIHVLLKSNEYRNLFIDVSEIEKMWGHGFVKIKKIKDNDNVGAYFSAHFEDIDVFEKNTDVSNERKCIVKGERLKFYPPNKKFYTYSKGIKKPVRICTTYGEAKEMLNFEECVYNASDEIVKKDIDSGFEKIVNHRATMQFNSKRKKKHNVQTLDNML